jgi:polar amino acid transport system substrate-binding protein
MLLAKRFDVLISYDLVGMSVAKDLGLSDRVNILKYAGAEEPLYVGFSKAKGTQAQNWATEFSRIFKQLKDEGFIDVVLQKYRQ